MRPLLLCAAGRHNGEPARVCTLPYLPKGKLIKAQFIPPSSLSERKDLPEYFAVLLTFTNL
jgi:hypothetical protein